MSVDVPTAAAVAAAIFRPELLLGRPGDGMVVLAVLDVNLIYEVLGYSDIREAWEVKDPFTGETTALYGAVFCPYVAQKVLHASRGSLPVRPGESEAESLASIDGWQAAFQRVRAYRDPGSEGAAGRAP